MLLVVVISFPVLAEISANDFSLDAWFASGTHKIRQNDTVKQMSSFEIKSARNEFEPFQLVLRSNESTSGFDVEITEFTGPGRIGSGNITIFLVRYLDITSLSSDDGQLGEWPDILCPKVDAYYHEERDFFPFNLTGGRLQPIWFDVFVPNTTTPGQYIATINVSQAGDTSFLGTVNLTVWDFSLPATSSLPNVFTMAMDNPRQGHSGLGWPAGGWNDIVEWHRVYLRAGLRHRISITPIPILFYDWNGTGYDNAYAQYYSSSISGFTGDGDPSVEYGRSELSGTSARLDGGYAALVDCDGGYTDPPQELIDRATQKAEIYDDNLPEGARDIFMILPLDEPGAGEVGCGSANPELDYNYVKEMALNIHGLGLEVEVTKNRVEGLLNTSNDPATNDYIDIWVSPFMNLVGRHWDYSHVDTRDEYVQDLADGAELWWYQSCMSHGCGITGGPTLEGYSQYVVEYPGMYTRAFPWMAYKYGIQGEVYYAVAGSYTADPWENLWDARYHGNGDGTFFYPGVPDTEAASLPGGGRGASTPSIGGTTHIPIESVRLKLIREGYEDYEYFHLLGELGGEPYAQSRIDTVVNTTYDFDHDSHDLYAAREEVALRIESILDAQDYHDADIDEDRVISAAEIRSYVGSWKAGAVGLSAMSDALDMWITGSY